MPTNIKQFLGDLKKETLVVQKAEVVFMRSVAFETFRRLVLRTPQDTGRARGNWQLALTVSGGTTIGRALRGDIGGVGSRAGQENIHKAWTTLQQLARLQNIYITNNVPYIKVLDEGGFVPKDPGPSKDPRPDRKGRTIVRGGFSVQAPAGMTGPVLEEMRRWVGGTVTRVQ